VFDSATTPAQQEKAVLTLDHLVILVHNLDRAVADYHTLGFTITPGGTHADGLTHNALIAFADGTYLELIAFVDPTDTRDNVWGWRQFVASGGGLIDYCFASDDLAADTARLRAHGLTIEGPSEGGRQRPDGVQLRWRSARFWQAGRELPFLIEDVSPRDRRVPGGAATTHANGAQGIHRLTVAITDLQRVVAAFAAITAAAAPPFSADTRLDGEAAPFPLGTTTLLLAAPAGRHSPLQQHIEQHGLGPYEVLLAGTATPTRRTLDARLTHGARLSLSPSES
jgi:catechol 2,3-dioxygenase-like lactoylglutathione lyase family enzyme